MTSHQTSVIGESPSTATINGQDDRLQKLLADNEKLHQELSVLRSRTEDTDTEKTLRAENEQLKKQLAKLGQLNDLESATQNSDNHNNQQGEGTKLTEQQELQRENCELLEQLVHEQEEVKTMEQERESLLMTIQLLQEELSTSEELRLSQSS